MAQDGPRWPQQNYSKRKHGTSMSHPVDSPGNHYFRFPFHCRAGSHESFQHLAKTQESVKILQQLSHSENTAKGLAALYAYESQIPEVATTKIAGLKKFYGINSEAALAFFKVHEKADEIHSQVTREALVKLSETNAQKQEALTAAATAVDALNLLLDGVYEEYCQVVN